MIGLLLDMLGLGSKEGKIISIRRNSLELVFEQEFIGLQLSLKIFKGQWSIPRCYRNRGNKRSKAGIQTNLHVGDKIIIINNLPSCSQFSYYFLCFIKIGGTTPWSLRERLESSFSDDQFRNGTESKFVGQGRPSKTCWCETMDRGCHLIRKSDINPTKDKLILLVPKEEGWIDSES